jgi:hypothetical protein
MFARNGILNVRYDGKMDRGSREIAVATFKKPGGPKVMLLRCACARSFGRCEYADVVLSTKCGSVGLNLTAANRCIKCVHCPL